MPTYTFRCSDCGRTEDVVTKIAFRDNPRFCGCGCLLTRVLSAPALRLFHAYQSPIDNHWIDSPEARRDDLKRNGCIEWEPGIAQDMPSIRQSNADRDWAPVEAAIDSTVRDMVAAGKIPSI